MAKATWYEAEMEPGDGCQMIIQMKDGVLMLQDYSVVKAPCLPATASSVLSTKQGVLGASL